MTDLSITHRDASLDDVARAALAADGLELRRIDTGDADVFAGWIQSVARGFMDGERTEAQITAAFERSARRRLLGVYDPSGPEGDRPVATFASWISELSVPGGGGLPSVAVSAVTVAPTHRRRGVLRAMMEGELRRADALGIPIAILTVSESTIYGRFGFAAAAMSGDVTFDVPRARWSGPRPDGRVDFISRERFREIAPAIHDRVRLATPGEIDMPDGHWDRFAGTGADAEHPERLRAVRYADATASTGARRSSPTARTTTISRDRRCACIASSPRPPTPTRDCGDSSSSSTSWASCPPRSWRWTSRCCG